MNKNYCKTAGIIFGLAAWVAPLLAGGDSTNPAPGATAGGWHLVWSDEFNQPDGSAPDTTKWGYDVGGNGWGNNELEYYTARTNNARIEDGKLVIEARKESYGGKEITSARLLTQGKWS